MKPVQPTQPAQLYASVSFCGSVCADQLELRYRLDGSQDAEILRSKVKNLANGQLHAVTISRLADSVSVQVTQKTLLTLS